MVLGVENQDEVTFALDLAWLLFDAVWPAALEVAILITIPIHSNPRILAVVIVIRSGIPTAKG